MGAGRHARVSALTLCDFCGIAKIDFYLLKKREFGLILMQIMIMFGVSLAPANK